VQRWRPPTSRFAANVYVGYEAQPASGSTVHYYAVPHFESAGGRALAVAIARQCAAGVDDFTPSVAGMRLAVLRETRMPAVLITLGDVQHALDHSPQLVQAVVTALELWAGRPAPEIEGEAVPDGRQDNVVEQ
jgi:hypothetical protein